MRKNFFRSISLITTAGWLRVEDGKTVTYNITPDTGYMVKDVVIDGESIGAKESYTFINVDKDHTISASFKKAPDEKVFVTKITLDKAEAGLYVGETLKLAADVSQHYGEYISILLLHKNRISQILYFCEILFLFS